MKEWHTHQKEWGYAASGAYALKKEKLEQDRVAKRAETFKALCSEGLELPIPNAPQEQLHKSWGSATTTLTTSRESSHAPSPGVPKLPLLQTGPMGKLQLGQPWPNTLPLWETWCLPPPSIITVGWSVEVVTWVDYIIRTLQGSEKWVLRFESCSEPRVTQQEFAWTETATVLGWVSSVRLTAISGAVAPKRSRDPDSPPTPSKQPPLSKRMIMPPLGFPAPLSEATQVSYAEMVQENQHLMDTHSWGQEWCRIMESALKPTLLPQLAPREPKPQSRPNWIRPGRWVRRGRQTLCSHPIKGPRL